MKKYAVFLDIDGVFCSHRVQMGHSCTNHPMWDKFDPVAIDFMNKIDELYNVDFVLMSTWKNHIKHDDPMYFHWINSSFRNVGFRGKFPWPNWKTNPLNDLDKYNHLNGRAKEVSDYLKEFGPYEDYLLFDDTDYDFNRSLGKKRWIRCSPEDGLLTKQMKHAMSLMGPWEKKNSALLAYSNNNLV